jgi:hypothetical protein
MEYAEEKLGDVFMEMSHLIEAHWKEVGIEQDMPPDPDLTTYECLEKGNSLKVYTVRDESYLAGYCIMFVIPSLHYKTIREAKSDMIYLRPEYRGNGLEFLEWVDEQLLAEGVKIVYHSVRPQKDYSKSLIALGYRFEEKLYSRRLGE